jgi:hypothetical protein
LLDDPHRQGQPHQDQHRQHDDDGQRGHCILSS